MNNCQGKTLARVTSEDLPKWQVESGQNEYPCTLRYEQDRPAFRVGDCIGKMDNYYLTEAECRMSARRWKLPVSFKMDPEAAKYPQWYEVSWGCLASPQALVRDFKLPERVRKKFKEDYESPKACYTETSAQKEVPGAQMINIRCDGRVIVGEFSTTKAGCAALEKIKEELEKEEKDAEESTFGF